MKILVILGENNFNYMPAYNGEITYACTGLENRHGDKWEVFRGRHDVVFTDGMEPMYFLAKHGIFPEQIIDGRDNSFIDYEYHGIDHIPD